MLEHPVAIEISPGCVWSAKPQQILRSAQPLARASRSTASARFIAISPAALAVRDLLTRVAPSEASVLLLGEHGTGKEVAARWLHARSSRAERPLVTLNAGGLADGVFESECFGHVRGAFTDAKQDRVGCFEAAHGGTLFLDEIGNMPLGQQAKLLRVLETGELQRVGSSRTLRVDVRVVTATNADLHRAAVDGRFRADLLYRLNTIEVELPPLRERREDIAPLAAHFLAIYTAEHRRAGLALTDAASRALGVYEWPGNVRELAHVIERAVLLAHGDWIDVEALRLWRGSANRSAPALDELPLAEAERCLVAKALDRTKGNVTAAAALLGLSRSALYRRLGRFRSI